MPEVTFQWHVPIMDLILDPHAWAAFVTLTALEIVLGIDNIVFITILAGRLPAAQRARARRLGLLLAMGTRVLLLLSLVWVMQLTEPLWQVLDHAVSGRDVLLLCGGLFLIGKSTLEIHASVETRTEIRVAPNATAGVAATVIQIGVLDIIFSLDSVVTAVGLVDQVPVMIAAIVAAVFVMIWASGPVGTFVERHPTIRMLALAFLILIGVALVAEGAGLRIPKGYIYFAMAFSLAVEMLNIRMRRTQAPPAQP
ncbi:MAG: TerC family protein [Chromatiaceae bacterium]|nr:TerC family protein [Gammaproteobacteria bacterium]MCP5301347.1 TerC family protein [Chromatiaceae bacterium]MCP5421887.1 TerC family protein [Chromatiaceae bacterium]